jgi:hypothetical protein
MIESGEVEILVRQTAKLRHHLFHCFLFLSQLKEGAADGSFIKHDRT